MKYRELIEQQQARYSAFPHGAAFTEEQLKEEMKRLQVHDRKELIGIGAGVFIRRTDLKEYTEMRIELSRERIKFLQVDENLFDALVYELGNHEYCVTYDDEEAVNALGLNIEEMDEESSERFMRILTQAKKYYLAMCE